MTTGGMNKMQIANQDTVGPLPAEHPRVRKQKIGVLLLNLGTPDATDYFSVRRYLSEFLSDKRVIDYPSWLWQPLLQGIILTSRPFRSGAAYASIWDQRTNESPLLVYTRSIAEKMSAEFEANDNIVIEFGMRYGNPSTPKMIKSLLDQGCTKILLFALYPQYSATTTATAYDKAFDYLKTIPRQPAIRTAPPWQDDPAYIELLAQSIQEKLDELENPPEYILTSFHGLPKRYLMQGDPYHCLCAKTSRLVREKLGWPEDQWITTFQSRFGPEEWLQPYTDKTIEKLAHDGVKRIAIVSPAFVCECIETLEEIAMEARDEFLENGGEEYTYIPCLNDRDEHIHLLSNYVRRELQGWV
ncbi:MAG: ferrochelatase [Bacteroidota bacterium]